MTLIPPYFNLFDYFLGDERLAEVGPRVAIEFRGSRITYDELSREVDGWRRRLVGLRVSQGDRVALVLYDSPEFIAAFLAAVSIGAVAVPINTFLSSEDVTFILADSGARAAIIEDELRWKANLSDPRLDKQCAVVTVDAGERPYLEPKDDPAPRASLPATTQETAAFLLYTSGSTGAPKGVLHVHGSMPYTVNSYSRTVLQLSMNDRLYSASRLFFAYGLGNSLSFPLAAGATVILDSGKQTPDRIALLLEEQAPTVFFGVPAVYRALLDQHLSGRRVTTSSLRLCVSAGEALPASLFEEWLRTFGLEIIDGIGSTEMLHIFISNRQGSAQPGSSGSVVEGYEAKLIDDLGAAVGENELGNLWVRGGSATAGYWNQPERTSETIRDGWVRTGDLYRRDARGYFFHVGRSDDCFKVRGLWVSPIEIEAVLVSHPAVAEAAVVPAIDSSGLATAGAYVVIRSEGDDVLKQELRELVGSKLAPHKVPTRIEFLEHLPRTSTGKIQRYKLRAAALSNGCGEENGDQK